MGDTMGMKEIETDANALIMAQSIDYCRELNIFVRLEDWLNLPIEMVMMGLLQMKGN